MGDLWVFGYGSLMWRPGFAFEESVPAKLFGAHRSLCVLSHTHRGTPAKPGLVLGLDLGGSCRGVAFRVAEKKGESVIRYLRKRELDSDVYIETHRPVVITGHLSGTVRALLYTVDRSHPQYAGSLARSEALRLVRQGHGHSGPNRDYVVNTADHLATLGIRDFDLEWLAERLR
ncbi:MAG: gamma-glutamylcyclotransferase [Hyphomicrobiales bacterium]|nr:gamma-glutamylcyclotransferase [Hyphomicrobiales bacterium]